MLAVQETNVDAKSLFDLRERVVKAPKHIQTARVAATPLHIS
jgi:hypothetical protein